MTIRVIDIETTGTDPAKDKVIEIASVDLTRERGITNEQEVLIDPCMPMPPESSAVHHLIDEDVQGQRTFSEAIQFFKGPDVVYVAHNAAFERGFLETHLPGTWICTMKCALRVWADEAPGFGNQTLRYWRGHVTPFGKLRRSIEPHRALSDCIVTAAILVDLMAIARWSDLVRWSSEPALYSRLTFGKHRGVRYADADQSYLEWIRDKSDLDADTKFSAAYWLDQRKAA